MKLSHPFLLFLLIDLGLTASNASAASAASAGQDVDQALRAATELENQGAYDAARRQLRALMRHVPPDLGEDLSLRVCALWRRQGHLAFARRCYADLASTALDSEVQGHARYRAAAAAVELEDEATGREELTRLVDDLPYTAGARRAFVLARSLHRDSGGAEQEADFLLGVVSRLAWVGEPGASSHEGPWARELLAEALVELGRIRATERHDPGAGLRVLERAMHVARGTVWEDDALIWTARTLHQMGRLGDALTLYQDLISAQQESWFVGDYHSRYFDDALYEVAVVLEEQHRLDDAEEAYEELARRVPTSQLVDDAAFRLAQIRARRRHDKAPLLQFVHDYPMSRHVRALRDLP